MCKAWPLRVSEEIEEEEDDDKKVKKCKTSSPGLGLVYKRPGRQLAPFLALRVLALGPDLLDDGGLEGLRGDEGGHFFGVVEVVERGTKKKKKKRSGVEKKSLRRPD